MQAAVLFRDELTHVGLSPDSLLLAADSTSQENRFNCGLVVALQGSHGPPLASHGLSAPVDVFILYPPPTSRPDVRLQCF